MEFYKGTRGIWKVCSMVFYFSNYHVWYHFKELSFLYVIAQILYKESYMSAHVLLNLLIMFDWIY